MPFNVFWRIISKNQNDYSMLESICTLFGTKEQLLTELNIKSSELDEVIASYQLPYHEKLLTDLSNGAILNEDDFDALAKLTPSKSEVLSKLQNIYFEKKFKAVFGSFEALAKMTPEEINDKVRENKDIAFLTAGNGFNILFYIILNSEHSGISFDNKKAIYTALVKQNPNLLNNKWCENTPFEYAVASEKQGDVEALIPLYSPEQLSQASVEYGDSPRRVKCLSYAIALGNPELTLSLFNKGVTSVQNLTITEDDELLAKTICANLAKFHTDALPAVEKRKSSFENIYLRTLNGIPRKLVVEISKDDTLHPDLATTAKKVIEESKVYLPLLTNYSEELTSDDMEAAAKGDTFRATAYYKVALEAFEKTGMPYLPVAEFLKLPNEVQREMCSTNSRTLHTYGFFTFAQYQGMTEREVSSRLKTTAEQAFAQAGFSFDRAIFQNEDEKSATFNWQNYYLLKYGYTTVADLSYVVRNCSWKLLILKHEETLKLLNRGITTFNALSRLPEGAFRRLLCNDILFNVCDQLDGKDTFDYFIKCLNTTEAKRFDNLLLASQLLITGGNKQAGVAQVTLQELNALPDDKLASLAGVAAKTEVAKLPLRQLISLQQANLEVILSENGLYFLRTYPGIFGHLANAELATLQEVVNVITQEAHNFTADQLKELLQLPIQKVKALTTEQAFKFFSRFGYGILYTFKNFESEKIEILLSDNFYNFFQQVNDVTIVNKIINLSLDKLNLIKTKLDAINAGTHGNVDSQPYIRFTGGIKKNIHFIVNTNDLEKLKLLLSSQILYLCYLGLEILNFTVFDKLTTDILKKLIEQDFGWAGNYSNFNNARPNGTLAYSEVIRSNIDNPPAEGICERLKFLCSKRADDLCWFLGTDQEGLNKLPSNVVKNLITLQSCSFLSPLLYLPGLRYNTTAKCHTSTFLHSDSKEFEKMVGNFNFYYFTFMATASVALCIFAREGITNVARAIIKRDAVLSYCANKITNLPFVNTL